MDIHSFKQKLTEIAEMLTSWLSGYFETPGEALQALAMAGAVVIVLLFFVARHQGNANQRRAAADNPVTLDNPVETSRPDNLAAAIASKDANNGAQADQAKNEVAISEASDDASDGASDDNAGTAVDGFVFHRRKSKQSREASAIAVEASGEEGSTGDAESALITIEQEMLATRQLYLDGVISKDVYVAETRALYGKAQQNM